MSPSRAELVIHPVRIRLLQALSSGPQSTQEISGHLPDVPKSSLYRHLRLLLEGGMIEVSETRLVQGIQEKVYELVQSPHLVERDLENLTADDHLRFFTTYVITLLREFADYVEASPELDMAEDSGGYTEVQLWATSAEIRSAVGQMNQAILPFLRNQPKSGRRRYKLATVLHH